MDELTRFARRLVEQLTATTEGVNQPVAVRLVREKLLPYRTHRRALQLDSVEDYETVLLRLVAGERGFVRTAPPTIARRCQEELAGGNPDLAILNEIADATVQITSLAAAQIMGDGDADLPAPPPPAPAAPVKPAVARAPAPREEPMPPQPPASRRTAEMASVPACPDCGKAAPAGRQVVFCPWCGKRLIPFTCTRCGTELESEWRHCITCGTPVKDPYAFS